MEKMQASALCRELRTKLRCMDPLCDDHMLRAKLCRNPPDENFRVVGSHLSGGD